MSPLCAEPRTARAGWRFALAALVAALLVVAHGCHGGDEDHELAPALLPTRQSSEPR